MIRLALSLYIEEDYNPAIITHMDIPKSLGFIHNHISGFGPMKSHLQSQGIAHNHIYGSRPMKSHLQYLGIAHKYLHSSRPTKSYLLCHYSQLIIYHFWHHASNFETRLYICIDIQHYQSYDHQ